jgi:hypothetical protein
VHRPQPQRLQDHDLQRAREKVAMFGVLCHIWNIIAKYLF